LKIYYLSAMHRSLLISKGYIDAYPTIEDRQLVRKVVKFLVFQW